HDPLSGQARREGEPRREGRRADGAALGDLQREARSGEGADRAEGGRQREDQRRRHAAEGGGERRSGGHHQDPQGRRSEVMIALFFAVALGTADGSMVVSGKATALHHAYIVEQNTLLKIIVSAEPIEDPASADDFIGIAVQLDEKKKAEEVFFFHPKLPAGLSVRQLSRFEATTVSKTKP